MAAVITLQALHGLSDNETVDAVTFDLRWKAACGLPITATAFHSMTLTYWRRRLAASDRPNRIFEAVKPVVSATGALAGKTRRALDSTVLDDAGATQGTVTQLIAAIRRVRREIPAAAPVIDEYCTAHDYDDPGKPPIAWNDTAARDLLVEWSGQRCPPAAGPSARARARAAGGRGGGIVGADRRPRRRTRRGLRSHRRSATRLTVPATHAPHSRQPVMSPSSNRSRCVPRFPVVSPATTSSSTSMPAP